MNTAGRERISITSICTGWIRSDSLRRLGLDDLIAENSILLIEWGEKFPRFVRERDVEIALERVGENERRVSE